MKIATIFLLVLLIPVLASTEDFFQKGTWDIGIWSGGGSALSEKSNDTNLWLTGIRLSRVLNRSGKLEYAVEMIPAFVVFQESAVYGIDFTPLLIKYNFKTQGAVIPYFEFGAGMLFSSSDVPEQTSSFNFTPQGGFGMHIISGHKRAFTVLLKYMHISNGGLKSPNPGLNSLQIHVGYNWFR